MPEGQLDGLSNHISSILASLNMAPTSSKSIHAEDAAVKVLNRP